MIGRLTGRVADRRPDRVLLDVGGVGYAVEIPLSTYYRIEEGDEHCSLHVHTHVREDALQLFGFASEDERRAFLALVGVNGVGPRLALAILSGIGADELALTVLGGDRERLQRIPGIGKKTAERLLLELRDKLPAKGHGDAAPGEAPAPVSAEGIAADALSALVNLGYSASAAEKAVARAATEQPDAGLEQLLRGALKGLVR